MHDHTLTTRHARTYMGHLPVLLIAKYIPSPLLTPPLLSDHSIAMHLLTLVAAFAGFASALPSAEPHVLHEKRDGLPVAWRHHSRAERSTVLPVRIGLKQRNLEHGSRYIADVADPKSPNFGMYYPQWPANSGTYANAKLCQGSTGARRRLPTPSCHPRRRRTKSPTG